MSQPAPDPVQRVPEDPRVVAALIRVEVSQRRDVAALQLLEGYHGEPVPEQARMTGQRNP